MPVNPAWVYVSNEIINGNVEKNSNYGKTNRSICCCATGLQFMYRFETNLVGNRNMFYWHTVAVFK